MEFRSRVLATAIVLAAIACGLFGQAGAGPAFTAASIKRNLSKTGDPTQTMGAGYRGDGRLTATNLSLRFLVRFAYAGHDEPHWMPLPAPRVVGGPAWIDSERYDIEGTPEGARDPERAWRMLQTLLADRFKLALHRETRELPVYILSAAPGGVKLPAAKNASCVSFPPGTPPHEVPGKVDCGYVPVLRERGGLRMQGSRLHMADLVRELTSVLDRPVSDRTGFKGEFDLELRFAPAEEMAGLPPGFGRVEGSSLPDIFSALEQLGLKLVAAKGPIEVIVIDRAEKPATN
jgi:uncharacterized protein (TIGR03435 family)